MIWITHGCLLPDTTQRLNANDAHYIDSDSGQVQSPSVEFGYLKN